MQNEAYQKLMDNLCDIVAEEQAKLGYMKEPIRLYYPLSSLNHFFQTAKQYGGPASTTISSPLLFRRSSAPSTVWKSKANS